MKSYKDFLKNRKQSIQEQVEDIVSCEPEFLEVEDLPNLLGESVENRNEPMDPPNVLIMRRVSIRQYPNKQRVALYFVDKINKYVTVPYTAMQWSSSGVATEEEVEHNIIDKLVEASESDKATKLIFENGSSMYINKFSSKEMLKLHESLSNTNKKEFVEIAGRSKEDFIEVQNFAKQS